MVCSPVYFSKWIISHTGEQTIQYFTTVSWYTLHSSRYLFVLKVAFSGKGATVKILKFGTPQTIVIIVLKIEKFDVTLH